MNLQKFQREDPELLQLIQHLENNVLPEDGVIANHVVLIIERILFIE